MNLTLAIFVTLIGSLGIAGWVLGIEALYRVFGDWVTMKPSTSVAVFVLGLFLMFRSRFHRRWVVPVLETTMTSVAGYMVLLYAMGASAQIAALDDPILSSSPGVPSLATLMCVVMFCVGMFSHRRWPWVVALAISVEAMIGYLMLSLGMGSYALVYYVHGFSTAMAFPTATAFSLGAVAAMRIIRSEQR